MSLLPTFIYIMRWLHSRNLINRWPSILRRSGYLQSVTLLTGMLLVSCSGIPGIGGNAGSANSASSAASVPISKLRWCGKPMMVFRDEGVSVSGTSATDNSLATPPIAATPRTISDWTQFKPDLNFTVFLPEALPSASCLLSVAGTSHDPVFGSSFTIGYLLTDHSALSLSEAPVRRSQTMDFQCSPTATTSSGSPIQSTASATGAMNAQNVVQLCSGVRGNTSIVFSSRGTTKSLQHFFQGLRSSIDWLPA
jgi:hypothetical protein